MNLGKNTHENSKEIKDKNLNNKKLKEISVLYYYLRNTNKNNDFSRSKLILII